MTYNIETDIRDYVAKNLLTGKLKNGDSLYDMKYFTSLYKVNPNVVKDAYKNMEDEGLIKKESDTYIITTDDKKLGYLKNEFINTYINELIKKSAEIGVSLDEIVDILNMRTMANG